MSETINDLLWGNDDPIDALKAYHAMRPEKITSDEQTAKTRAWAAIHRLPVTDQLLASAVFNITWEAARKHFKP